MKERKNRKKERHKSDTADDDPFTRSRFNLMANLSSRHAGYFWHIPIHIYMQEKTAISWISNHKENCYEGENNGYYYYDMLVRPAAAAAAMHLGYVYARTLGEPGKF